MATRDLESAAAFPGHGNQVKFVQRIFPFHGDPEEYVRCDAHLGVIRPQVCPNCTESNALLALGYYSRWVSSSTRERMLRILVRRFRCVVCRQTTSMLPDFAQPYRLVATDTVDGYLAGNRSGEAVSFWLELLGCYQRKFDLQLPETRVLLCSKFGFDGLPSLPVKAWDEMRGRFGGARRLTITLATEAGVTVFGTYGCHSPSPRTNVHTSPRFTCERAPPF